MSKAKSFDVDIDVKSHTEKDRYGVRAIIYDSETLAVRPHPSGYFVECAMPVDGMTGNAALDYKDAEERGFIKVDILTNSAYDGFNSKQDVLNALDAEPDWDSLKDPEFVAQLPHIADHFDVVEQVSPQSIDDLADVLALIRPGKMHLLSDYLENKALVRQNLYRRPKTGMFFKKSHSYSYAAMIICVMNNIDNRTLVEF